MISRFLRWSLSGLSKISHWYSQLPARYQLGISVLFLFCCVAVAVAAQSRQEDPPEPPRKSFRSFLPPKSEHLWSEPAHSHDLDCGC